MQDRSNDAPDVTAPIRAALKDPSKPFAMLVRLQVKEGAEARWQAAFAKAAVETRREKGVLDYTLYHDASQPTRFVLYERWRSLADLEAHVQAPYITALFGEVQAVAAGPVEINVLLPAEA